MTPTSRIFVVADADIVTSARRLLPDIPPQNFVIEVSPRSTWPSCVLGTAVISHVVAEDAAVLVLPADHAVRDEEAFGRVLTTGVSRVREGGFVTFGVTPTRPETGYGYIRRGQMLASGPPAVHRGLSFHEKPTRERAAAYLAAGDYAWNSGMFGWRADVFFAAAAALRPAEKQLVADLFQAVTHDDGADATQAFLGLEPTSIDYALMERLESFEVVTMDCGWDDVGSFDALERVVPNDGNVVVGDATVVDGRGNVVISEGGRPVVLGGVEDIVVVDAGDVVAVYKKGQGQAVREVVAMIEKTLPGLT